MTDGTNNATYAYLANSPLASTVTCKSNTTTQMTTTRQYDFLDRLPSPISYAYLYNDANQRLLRTESDASRWAYEYDKLGQVTSGKRYWSDGSPVPGQQFEYGFDDIGNRNSTKAGGDANGANLRSASYTATPTNTYSSRTVPGAVDVVGLANFQASVTVDSSAADYRRGEYFQELVTTNNSSTPVWLQLNVTAVNGGSSSNWPAGYVFVPKTAENFTYDQDGNLTSDGRFNYTWDGENRLKQVESLASGPTASKRRLVWEYDGQGRRIRQTIYSGASGSYVVTSDLKLLNDGWRCVAELNATNNAVVRSYMWGLDLSGSLDGAGGVGGLLLTRNADLGTRNFAAYDGNGNVVALVSAGDGTVTANYEYDPFGQTIRMSGVAAKDNPWRFSTKRVDNETDLVWYEYRAYSPSLGRFISRDPMEEKGGLSLFGFVTNQPLSVIDPVGLEACNKCGPDVTRPLKETMRRIARIWNGLDPTTQDLACKTINGLGPEGPEGARKSFDIEELAYFQPMYSQWQPFLRPGTGDCAYTVAVEGRCFDAIGVNYTIWGHLNSLCSKKFIQDPTYSLGHSIWLAALYKGRTWQHWPGSRYSDQAIGFTVYGYNDMRFGIRPSQLQDLQVWLRFFGMHFSPEQQAAIVASAQSPPATEGCTVDPSNIARHSCFSWVWHPFQDRQWQPNQLYPFPR